jgi:hypothetical protein
MRKDFSLPIDRMDVVLIDRATVSQALTFVSRCEGCSAEAEIPFDSILDRLTERDPRFTDYLIEITPPCPSCLHPVTEKTRVQIQN